MLSIFFFNFLSFIIILNFLSSYNSFFLSVDHLFFLIFITIFLSFFFFVGDLLKKYLHISRYELLREFFLNILDLLFVLNFYKRGLLVIVKNLNFFFWVFKFLFSFLNNFFRVLVNKFIYSLTYFNANLLNNYFFDFFISKKNFLTSAFLLQKEVFFSNFFFSNVVLRDLKVFKWISNI
jgi:hypothetical protein